jgi:HK97 family phage prohead protease
MPVKTRPMQLKALGEGDGLQDGQFRALVSVFGNVDSYGDMVMPGAFTQTLSDWKSSGNPIPILWSHQLDDPDMNIGYVLDAEETDQGLEVLGQLDIAADSSPKARSAHRLLKGGRVTQFSFAYDVLDQAQVDDQDGERNELRALKLYEVSPTLIGANDQTELIAVKAVADAEGWAADVHAVLGKVGRVISAKNESTLREAVAALDSASTSIKNVLAALDSGDGQASNTPSETSGVGPVKDEEPPVAAKSEEPNRRTSVTTWDIQLLLSGLETT